jgi:hypothetical protein
MRLSFKNIIFEIFLFKEVQNNQVLIMEIIINNNLMHFLIPIIIIKNIQQSILVRHFLLMILIMKILIHSRI